MPARTPAPPPRLGPRPLPLHLGMALSVWLSSLAALRLSRSGSLNWRHADQAQAKALQEALAQADPEALARALGAEAATRIGRFLEGIEGYRAHPYRRRLADPPVLWQAGTTRVLAFGGDAVGAPVLLVPSLINRAYILDLTAQRSFARYLRERGLRPLPARLGRARRGRARIRARRLHSGPPRACAGGGAKRRRRPVVLAGYCMGGTMVLPLAVRADVAALVLLATPWDFWADGRHQARLIAAHLPGLTALIDGLGQLPPDALQAMFAALDPLLAARKFSAFAALPPASAAARNFVALEDWLNDAVPLTGPVARACLEDWYGTNAPARGNWRVGGEPMRPERVTCPALNVVPARDRIVPPASAEALSAALPDVETWRPPLGHIGMMASPRAKRLLWRKLADWISVHATA